MRARLQKILHRVDVNTLEHLPASMLHVNDIAVANIETTLPLFFDSFRHNRTTGSFILIDPITNATVAAGMIEAVAEKQQSEDPGIRTQEYSRNSPRLPVAFWIVGRQSVAEEITEVLQKHEHRVQLVSGTEFSALQLAAVARVLQRMGVSAVLHLSPDHADLELKQTLIAYFGQESVFHADLPASDSEAVATMIAWMHNPERE